MSTLALRRTVFLDGRAPPGTITKSGTRAKRLAASMHFVNLVMALRRARRELLHDFLLIVSKCLAIIDQWLHCTVQSQ